MSKPLSDGHRKKIDSIAKEIISISRRSGPIAVNQTPTFQAISRKGTKIKLARAFSRMVNAGEINGVVYHSKTAANHSRYSAAGVGGAAAGSGTKFRKGFWQRLFGG